MDIEKIAKQYGKPVSEFRVRLNGKIEWVCEHGIGHTVWYPKGSDGVHACDGCCHKLKKKGE